MSKTQMDEIVERLERMPPLLSPYRISILPDQSASIPPPRVCPYPRDVTCDAAAIYRTFDGSCNNFDNPLWGSVLQPLIRFLHADYADGKYIFLLFSNC